jgi:hypothetical protein
VNCSMVSSLSISALQGLAKDFPFKAILSMQFVNSGKFCEVLWEHVCIEHPKKFIFGICNSQFSVRKDFFGLWLKVVSTCRAAYSLFTHTRTVTSFLLTNSSLDFKVVKVPHSAYPYKIVFCRPAGRRCMNLFSRTQSSKVSSLWETPYLKGAEPGGKDKYYGEIPPVLKSLWIWLCGGAGQTRMLVWVVVTSYIC